MRAYPKLVRLAILLKTARLMDCLQIQLCGVEEGTF